MITVEQIKLPVGHTREDLCNQLCKMLGLHKNKKCPDFEIVRRSIDARKKPDIFFVYSVRITEAGFQLSKKADRKHVKEVEETVYSFSEAVCGGHGDTTGATLRLPKCPSTSATLSLPKCPSTSSGHGSGQQSGYESGHWSEQQSGHGSGLCSVRHLPKETLRPVIAGFGPAGMFCALMLARAGLKPVVLERGKCVEERIKDTESFFAGGELNENSNIQFGEGGAGTFSDGKLNTGVGAQGGRSRMVLETFVKHGAPEEILYDNKPHIGTDILVNVVRSIREEIKRLGGEVLFDSCLVDIVTCSDESGFDGYATAGHLEDKPGENKNVENYESFSNNEAGLKSNKCVGESPVVPDVNMRNSSVAAVMYKNTQTGEIRELEATAVCLAIGHSARDTFAWLEKKAPMQQKAFAVGLRIEHPQSLIDKNMYGDEFEHLRRKYDLPAADYKLTAHTADGRGVYSFCMCPGGYVVNSSSEKGQITVNGMSCHARDGRNANSALIVTVSGKDFGGGVLDGVSFQRRLEKAAFAEGEGKIPVQLLEDFVMNRTSTGLGRVEPCIKGAYKPGNLRNVLPDFISDSIIECMEHFNKKIPGFFMPDSCLSGVESRTSSPVRILRGEGCMSDITGLFPCGEGAGYAGGIMSSAVDGIKCGEGMASYLSESD